MGIGNSIIEEVSRPEGMPNGQFRFDVKVKMPGEMKLQHRLVFTEWSYKQWQAMLKAIMDSAVRKYPALKGWKEPSSYSGNIQVQPRISSSWSPKDKDVMLDGAPKSASIPPIKVTGGVMFIWRDGRLLTSWMFRDTDTKDINQQLLSYVEKTFGDGGKVKFERVGFEAFPLPEYVEVKL